MGFDWLLSRLHYGDAWRRGRRLLHAHVHPGVSPRYHSTQLLSARRFARDILNAKQDNEVLPHVIRANIGRTIIKIVYGIDVKDSGSEFISMPEKVIGDVNEGSIPGRFLVDFLPICKRYISRYARIPTHYARQ
jgi:cytochrome P450